jgi:PTH2 family peptidyl-tRNA hydrolase
MLKQYIVVRKDLDMSKGRIAAQVAHASLMCIINNGTWNGNSVDISYLSEEILKGLKSGQPFTKIVLFVYSKKDFNEVVEKVSKEKIPFYVMKDNGFYNDEGNEILEETCLAIGPCDDIEELKWLKLL